MLFRRFSRWSLAPAWLFLLFAFIIALPAPAMAEARFTGEPKLASDAGNAAIGWEGEAPFRLTMTAPNGATRTVYEGRAHSYFVSGLLDGAYSFRIADADGEAASPLILTVGHQSLSRALWLVALGALAFLATVIVILRGARDD